ncbi:MAG: YtxH domain-containing protein [Bacteroidaceae bacterium]|nr:YtxH domain-containing protein [Bacteroidaceae bacterium]
MKLGYCFTAFAAGMLFGGIMVALFVPKCGKELRSGIKRRLDEAKERVAGDCCPFKGDADAAKEDVVISIEE